MTGLSKGAFKNPKSFDRANAATDSLNGVIVKLSEEKGVLSATVKSLTDNNGKLEKQVNELQGKVSQLTQQLDSCKEHQSLLNVIFTPPGCYVTIVLVIALTIICLKKGFSIAKGDIKITTGDTKKGE